MTVDDWISEAKEYASGGWALSRKTAGNMAERLEALEEIRRRVADGWCAAADGYYEAAIWYRVDDDGFAKLSPEVASVLWPTTEGERAW